MNALQILQRKAGVKPDGVFGQATFRAASAFLHLSDNRAIHFSLNALTRQANLNDLRKT